MLRIHWKYILFLVGLATIGLLATPLWTVDDAFISYRYAQNWVEHGQISWNIDQSAVEGYTGIFLVALAAFFQQLGLEVSQSIQLLSVLAVLGSSILIFNILLGEGLRKEIALLTGAAYLLSPLVYIHAFSGLETSIFIFLLLGMSAFLLQLAKGGSSTGGFLFGIGCLLGLILIRPEGVAYSAIALSSWYYLTYSRLEKQVIIQFLTLAVLGFAFICFYLWFKYKFYGSIFPNTYYAKQYSGPFSPDSVWELMRFGAYYLTLPGLAGLVFWFRVKNKPVSMSFKFMFATFLVFAAVTSFTYLRSNLFMNYGHRFFFPLWPLFLILLGWVVDRGWKRNGGPQFSLSTKLFLGLLLLGHFSIMGFRYFQERLFLLNYRAVMEEEWKPAADFLSQSLPGESRLICYQDAGWIPYKTGFTTYDFGRLNDIYLAREQPSFQQAADYFFSLNVDALVMTSWSGNEYKYWDEGLAIHNDPRMARYKLAKVFDNGRGYPYTQWVYLKRTGSSQ